jgi:predicted acyl esterase
VKVTSVGGNPHFNYPGFSPGKTIIPQGHVKSPGGRAFPNGVIFERDVAIPMRDGIKIDTDVFRP